MINKLCLLFIVSVFLPKFYMPYFVLLIGILYLLIKNILFLRKIVLHSQLYKQILFYGIILVLCGFISWVYNVIFEDSDLLSILLWLSTYTFPFFIILFFSLKQNNLSYEKLFNFYKKILFVQLLIGIYQAVAYRKFVGDHIKGTCVDAHILGVNFAVGAIITFTDWLYTKSRKSLVYFITFFIGLIMTGYTSNIVFLFLILFLAFIIRTKFLTKIPVTILMLFIFSSLVLGIVFVREKNHGFRYVQYGITEIAKNLHRLKEFNLGGKIYSYKTAFFDIPQEINILIGYGPASYTSRASQMRIPHLAVHKLPVNIGTKMTNLFEKYILPWYFEGDTPPMKGYSLGTLSSPMTSVISIWVELGILGFLVFIFFFLTLFKYLKKVSLHSFDKFVQTKNSVYLLIYFIILMFYLNYWEYPQVTIPIFSFYCLTLKQ